MSKIKNPNLKHKSRTYPSDRHCGMQTLSEVLDEITTDLYASRDRMAEAVSEG